MNAWLPRVILPMCLLVVLSTAALAQVVVTDDFESNNVGDFPAGWTQLNGSVGYALITSSPVASGSRAVRLSAGLSTASTIRFTTAITNDYVYEYYVLLPDTGNVNETIGSVKVENVGMSFALGATSAEGRIYFSSTTDGFSVPTNVWHHVKVHVDYQKNVFSISVNGGAPKKYPASINTSNDLRLEAASLSSSLQKHIVYVDSVTVSLMTVDLTPAYTTLSNPANGATGLGASSVPSFSWSSVSQSTGYTLQISTDSTFATGIVYDDTTITGTSKSVPLPPLNVATTYFWRVRAKNTIGWGDWSAHRTFRTVDPPPAPEPYNPSPGQEFTSTDDVYFSFSSPSGTDTYHFQIAIDSLFTNVVVNDSASSANSWRYVSYPPLEVLKRYYWRVRSFGVAGWGAWSPVRDFTTPQLPAPPVLGAPAQGAQSTDLTQIYFWWNSVSGATEYGLVIAKDSNFTQIVVNDSLASTAVYQYFPPLEYNTTYYWRVRTGNVAGWGVYSGWRSFRTKPVPTVTSPGPANGNIEDGNTVELWGSTAFSDAADSFYVQIALDTAFTQIVADSTDDVPYVDFPIGLFAPSTTYYWRMRAHNVAGWGPFTARRSFVIAGPPPAPTLSSPSNNAIVNSVPVYFSWNSGSAVNIQDYRLQIASDSLFTNILVDTVADYSGFYAGDGRLVFNTRYYWRVRTRTYVGSGPYSAYRWFLTPQRPSRPVVVAPVAGSLDLWGNVTIRWQTTPGKDGSQIQITTDTSTAPSRILAGGKARRLDGGTIVGFHYGPVISSTSELQVNVSSSPGGLMISGAAFEDPLYTSAGQQIFIRVCDFNEAGQSDFSAWNSCSVLRTPEVPTGCEPADGATGVTFVGTAFSTDPLTTFFTNANVTVAPTSSMLSPVFQDRMFDEYGDNSNRLFAFAPSLLPNTTYYYQITAYNGAGVTTTPVFSFQTADPAPVFTCVMDVENDQGGFIDVDFLASELDRGPTVGTTTVAGLFVTDYTGWRIHPEWSVPIGYREDIRKAQDKLPEKIRDWVVSLKTTDLWEPVFQFPAIGEDHYRVTVKSRTDSGRHGTGWETFVVIAHGSTGHQFRSRPDSGYSKDNLAPSPPVGGSAAVDNGQVRIAWAPNDEKDLKEYVVYRSLNPNDPVSSMTPIGTTTEPSYLDASPPNVAVAYYYVVARDKNDNDGEPAIITATIVTGVESLGGVPTEYSLAQNYPNPFNPSTTIRFGVPFRSRVVVQIANTLGQVVETLTEDEFMPGFYGLRWEARVPSGIYLYRIAATSLDNEGTTFTSIKKMVLVK